MSQLTESGRRIVSETAARHGVTEDTVARMFAAVARGGGTQAQFDIPELGGMGQWSQGGMTMVGDMFNTGLQARVSALCADLAHALRDDTSFQPAGNTQSQSQNGAAPSMPRTAYFEPEGRTARWPDEFGPPSSEGAQNDTAYAVFPQVRRLAIERNGRVTIYDTGDHRISGVSQSQGVGHGLTFTSQHGLVGLSDLPEVSPKEPAAPVDRAPAGTAAPTARPDPEASSPVAAETLSDDAIFSRLERLAELRDRGILSDEEFAAKKAELLARL
ncbi:SHOCT domain-containing protein [Histidinibacterium aquaticum]|uniref:SHOCT domain-containing protein n=1 Tax=Histidinibacterium aquaticum TaxID=2613962 RepID=A0A5J5GP63_9RHOB|nr:SHOCT domain-containing protein [Histidinibacterium aquaticum]KAA9010119.1 SHOCT domain-containing protein [Histidinibacterium aquaticum]